LHYITDLPRLTTGVNELLKPNGVFISSTACMNEKITILRFILKIASKIGHVAKMKIFKKTELEHLIKNGNTEMIKSVRISNIPEYFIVTKKRK
jgi:2-polyprenyl-3-methyl-5-hydroxy-6-metoxy-1,4-benzoquinol methylase